MLGYLSSDIRSVLRCLGKTVNYEELIISKNTPIYKHIFPPNGCYCVYRSSSIFGTRRKIIVYGLNVSFMGYCFLFNFL